MKKLFIVLLLLPGVAFANHRAGTLAANGDSLEITCPSGIVGVGLDGTWDGATVGIYADWPTHGYKPVRVNGTEKTWTANDDDNVDKSGPTRFKLTMSSAGASSDVDYLLNCANTR